MKTPFYNAKIIFRILAIHFFAIVAIGLSFYYNLQFVCSLLYLCIMVIELRNSECNSLTACYALNAIWQFPALFFSVVICLDLSLGSISDNAIFLLQFWNTPIYPWLVLLDMPIGGYSAHYYALLLWPWISIPIFSFCMRFRKTNPLLIS